MARGLVVAQSSFFALGIKGFGLVLLKLLHQRMHINIGVYLRRNDIFWMLFLVSNTLTTSYHMIG